MDGSRRIPVYIERGMRGWPLHVDTSTLLCQFRTQSRRRCMTVANIHGNTGPHSWKLWGALVRWAGWYPPCLSPASCTHIPLLQPHQGLSSPASQIFSAEMQNWIISGAQVEKSVVFMEYRWAASPIAVLLEALVATPISHSCCHINWLAQTVGPEVSEPPYFQYSSILKFQ